MGDVFRSTNNRRDTIEVSVSELVNEINSRFESKPLVPLKSPFRPRPVPGPSPLFKPIATIKPKSILKSSSTVNVCSPNSACGSSWVVVHSDQEAIEEVTNTMTRSVSFNDVDSYSWKGSPSSSRSELSLSLSGSLAPPNTPATPRADLPSTTIANHKHLTNMRNDPLAISPQSLSKSQSVSFAHQKEPDMAQSNSSGRPRAVSTSAVSPKSSSKPRLVFPKPSPRHSRYKARPYTQGTRPITRANSANSAELIWKPGWAGNKVSTGIGNGKKLDLGDIHPRKLDPETKRAVARRDKSLPPPPFPDKNSIAFPKVPPTPTSRPSFRSFSTFSSASTLASLDDAKSFNLLDLVVKLKKKLSRLSRRSQRTNRPSPGAETPEHHMVVPVVEEAMPKRKVSFILPEDQKNPHHPTFKRRSSPYPRDQIASDDEDEEEQTEIGSKGKKAEDQPGIEDIMPLKRTDDFVSA